MCGIAGFFYPAGVPGEGGLEAKATRMAERLTHRGPDAGGCWVDASAGVALAHRRLSIIDLSAEGNQPMVSADGRYVISFNGEIYNYLELRGELSKKHCRFRGTSDTEVMLAAFSEWGFEKAVVRFNGMFAFALWDRQERLLHFARDRFGEKPLYYALFNQGVLFASELKALRAFPDFSPEVDRGALALFMRHNYVPGPFSIYQGVRKLPPASLLTVRAGDADARPRLYWDARDRALASIQRPVVCTREDAVDQLEMLLRDAVKLRMHADVPLGAFLSGGIDSSTIVALMQVQSARPVKTFTIGFEEEGYNEAVHAKAVARHLGTEHTELYLAPQDALDVIPRLPAIYDEPFSDSSQIPTFLVSQLARRHVTVSLTGDGGDELFGGYNRYSLGEALWGKTRWIPKLGREGLARLLRFARPGSWESGYQALSRLLPARLRVSNPADKLAKLAEVLSSDSGAGIYRRLVSHWMAPERVVLGASEPVTVLADAESFAHAFPTMTEQMMVIDGITYLPDDILVKVDRASMAVSLESRVPLLDHRVFEFAWRLPVAWKIRAGVTKWPLRQVLYRHVPRSLVQRPKMGFGVPIDAWLRGPLRDWARDLLSAERLRRQGYFDPAPIQEKLSEHLSGMRAWHYLLWDVLMFEAWLDAHHSGA